MNLLKYFLYPFKGKYQFYLMLVLFIALFVLGRSYSVRSYFWGPIILMGIFALCIYSFGYVTFIRSRQSYFKLLLKYEGLTNSEFLYNPEYLDMLSSRDKYLELYNILVERFDVLSEDMQHIIIEFCHIYRIKY